ncbi:hypothetical protein PHYBLDRAFT_166202 [Phycomyces blakesleeanus NRRL 1555(-)]|uniref:Uncharacterized protein n=1 Tax=Phycomyces blakesleeanus (strain ATCC 8743b / DSM 1359 / FGSC 10004 / NBRC 33097 / NRRL 1555) TaxID=763407 RepID=A0A167NLT4_PHYB8|nr:hypothetical protein PHYBLDRAFT_166202 [Phycomyces blakesleeanus NRRL 1555(-)]OAD76228.1 hypothetical protein PHYBLDRAFT_166202 [Phycomyces blakesleeanus NRRL 1555(-)]|eukprot:XP_018294268.1 hypothetical protein PHYBLDRAFT_166202 [Phycomyces blakesleeanus NRRL 1555(-)]
MQRIAIFYSSYPEDYKELLSLECDEVLLGILLFIGLLTRIVPFSFFHLLAFPEFDSTNCTKKTFIRILCILGDQTKLFRTVLTLHEDIIRIKQGETINLFTTKRKEAQYFDHEKTSLSMIEVNAFENQKKSAITRLKQDWEETRGAHGVGLRSEKRY